MSRQMAPWVPLFQQSCKNNLNEVHPFTPFQFSTVEVTINEDGQEEIKPRVRTVVLRDFLFNDKKTNVLTFNTDLRSDKIMRVNSKQKQFFESCFYFPGTWEQYRLSGEWFTVSLNGKNDIDDEILAKYGILIKEEVRSTQSTPIDMTNNDNVTNKDTTTTTTTTTTNDEHDDKRNNVNDNDKSGEEEEEEDAEIDGEITEIIYRFPECNDWNEEVMREWTTLSRAAKSLYRKPPPGEILTNETSQKLDKIQRGVDGAKEDAGLENFAVVCLCIDQVDYLNLKDGRGGERRVFRRCFDTEEELEEEEEDDDVDADETLRSINHDNKEKKKDENEIDEEEDEDVCGILSGHEIWTEEEVCP